MTTLTGLDRVLLDPTPLQGQRIGLLVHAASVDHRLNHALGGLAGLDLDIAAVFGPQHGVWGETQDNMIEWRSHRDEASGIPFHSLYGRHREPTGEMLADIETIVVDLQDVGARYYTFIQTLSLVMRAASLHGRRVVVLDRPNPIGGELLEGPVLDPAFSSFVGLFPLAVRHGMTIGEIATYLKADFEPGCDLEILPMAGWRRESYFDETGLPWVLPSPNMPTLDTAVVYPGMCLLEGTNLSEGRGTTRPFEICGAPWIEPASLKQSLDACQLPGVVFRPVSFIPTFQKWAGQQVGGVQLHVVDRQAFLPFLTAVAIIIEMRRAGGAEFQWNEPPYEYEETLLPFDILCGTDEVRALIESNAPLNEISESSSKELAVFERHRRRFLLY